MIALAILALPLAWIALGIGAPFIIARYDRPGRSWGDARDAVRRDIFLGDPVIRFLAWPIAVAYGPIALGMFAWAKLRGRA